VEISKKRCRWTGDNLLMIAYHDMEWGVPVHEDQTLFEFLILEGAQAGLTWQTVLNKRENYREAFDNFQVDKIAKYGSRDIMRLLANSGIIRNRLKIESTIQNAKAFLRVKKEFNTFDAYVWQFVGNRPIIHSINMNADGIIPVSTKESDAMSKDLVKRGFKFVGPTICYAFMQAVGMVNDHEISCFRHKMLK
jgi:DNA-3-methyladenine glycosylase I